jgi:hypothetical protein
MPQQSRPHLQTARSALPIPPGARSPSIPSPIDSWNPYLEGASPNDRGSYWPYAEGTSGRLRVPERPPSRAASLHVPESPTIGFPEYMGRSASYASSLLAHHPSRHRPSRSDAGFHGSISRRESLDYSIEASPAFTLALHLHNFGSAVGEIRSLFPCTRAIKPQVCASTTTP